MQPKITKKQISGMQCIHESDLEVSQISDTFRCCKNFIFADLFDIGNVKRAFKTTFKRRPYNVRHGCQVAIARFLDV